MNEQMQRIKAEVVEALSALERGDADAAFQRLLWCLTEINSEIFRHEVGIVERKQ